MSGPGIRSLASDQYHADHIANVPSLSASIAHVLLSKTPRHAWTQHPRLNPNFEPIETAVMDNGTAAHSLLFEHRKPVIVQANDWRTKAAQEQRNEARARGQVALLEKDARHVQQLCDAISQQLDDLDADPRPFTDGKAEQTLVWEEPGDVVCRARLDWLRNDHTAIDDLKTTTSADPREWTRRRLWEDGKDIQAAFYLRGLKHITGTDAAWRFVVVENKPPFALSVISLAPAAVELANAKVQRAIDLWRDCVNTNTWPAYPTRVCFAELPPWEEARWLERQVLEDMDEAA